jgi:hypothetical protein
VPDKAISPARNGRFRRGTSLVGQAMRRKLLERDIANMSAPRSARRSDVPTTFAAVMNSV